MTNILRHKPEKLGFYKLELFEDSELAKRLKMNVITARLIERRNPDQKVRRYFDLPRPKTGIKAWELIEEEERKHAN